ncbi:sensor histidine kinase [Qipengyuania aurantiaca]|uniref:sensor histidine kinase n=1 Tax=Qipengyuania aurantiaca TaxID=2867233 RepID=UPI0024943F24|nr:HWE histidine kinase domain-containing protein [Qipengyuania aurantiaca]
MTDLRPFEELSADHLRLILNTAHIGIWELDLESGHASRNHHHDRIFGYHEGLAEWTYDKFIEHVVPEQREEVDRLQKDAIASGVEWAFDCAIITADGERKWISAAGRPLAGPGGDPAKLIGHVIDISETKEREARLSLLTEELNHRVRNMLSVIKSIVRLSARKANTVNDFATALEGRVASLARSHSLMVADASAKLCPSEILQEELAAIPGIEDRVDVQIINEEAITGAVGQGLSLVLHELVTNALKYGALSGKEGNVSVCIEEVDGQIKIAWRECGGPRVDTERKAGFGSSLIAQALSGHGKVDLRYPVSGVECDISLTP